MDILLSSVTKLVNLSLAEGVFPQKFKKVIVIFLIKKTSLSSKDLKIHRPVSGLCFMSKLVVWVVVKQHIHRVNSNNPGPCCISKMRFISLSLGKPTSYSICWLDLTSFPDSKTLVGHRWLWVAKYSLWATTEPLVAH